MTRTAVSAPGEAGPERSAARTWQGSRVPAQILVLTARSMRALLLDPRLLLVSLLSPVFMLLVFSQVFSSMAATPSFPDGVGYVQFLMPAILVNWSLHAGIQSGVGLAQDMRNGIVARFRSLPIWLGSVLIARCLADMARGAQQLLAFLVIAYAVFGFPDAGGVPGALGAWLLAALVGGGVSWVFIALACWVRKPELLHGVLAVVTFPLMFASNAFVPLEGLPWWLRTVAALNPMTHTIDAARGLMLGHPSLAHAVAAVGTATLIGVAAALLALRGFRRHP